MRLFFPINICCSARVLTKGMTLIEIIVYIGLLSTLMTVFLSSFVTVSEQNMHTINNIHDHFEQSE